MKPLLSTWPVFMPGTIPRCTMGMLDAQIMGRVSHFTMTSNCRSARHCLMLISLTFPSLCADNTQGGVMRAAEKHSHMGSMKVSFITAGTRRPSCHSEAVFVFWSPENNLVPFHHLVPTRHRRISAWTLATAQKSLCTLAAVCSLLLTSWQHCGPRTRSLC